MVSGLQYLQLVNQVRASFEMAAEKEFHIDGKFKKAFPLNENKILYMELGRTTSILTVSKINCDNELVGILCLFPELRELRMMHITHIPTNTERYFLSLRPQLQKLTHLYLEGDIITDNHLEMCFMPKLEHLEIMCRGRDSVKTLIISRDEPRMNLNCRNLEYYQFHNLGVEDSLILRMKNIMNQLLTILSLPSIPEKIDWITNLKSLRKLNIRDGLRTQEEKNMLSDLQKCCPNLEITYTIDPYPVCNQILVLNKDCLVEIFSYLKTEQQLSMAVVHSKFISPFVINHKRKFGTRIVIDHKFMDICPVKTSMNVYEKLGSFITKLTIDGVNEKDFFTILSYFKILKNLITNHQDFQICKITTPVQCFPPLKYLAWDSYEEHENSTIMSQKFFKFLNPTLIKLKCYMMPISAVKPLQNLQVLDITSNMMADPDIGTFLKKNKMLQRINVRCGYDGNKTEAWNIMSRMKNLKTIEVKGLDYTEHGLEDLPIFHNLDTVFVEFIYRTSWALETFLSKMGPQLKNVYIKITEDTSIIYDPIYAYYKPPPNIIRMISHLKNLQELCINAEYYGEECLMLYGICGFTKMRSIYINADDANLMKGMIKSMPDLAKIRNNLLKTTSVFDNPIFNPLRSNDQMIEFNGG